MYMEFMINYWYAFLMYLFIIYIIIHKLPK